MTRSKNGVEQGSTKVEYWRVAIHRYSGPREKKELNISAITAGMM